MESITLFEFVRNLSLYFERKMPSNETLEQWYPEVEFIPSEALEWIAKKIKSLDTWPRNLPAALKSCWYQWLESNPNKQVKEEFGCNGCLAGYIQVSYYVKELGGWYHKEFRCDQCRPEYPKAMPLSNVNELYQAGYYRPLRYLTSFKYANLLPIPEIQPVIKTTPVKPGPVDDIVQGIADEMELPF